MRRGQEPLCPRLGVAPQGPGGYVPGRDGLLYGKPWVNTSGDVDSTVTKHAGYFPVGQQGKSVLRQRVLEICGDSKRETPKQEEQQLWLRAEALSKNAVAQLEHEVFSPKGSCVKAWSPLDGALEKRLDQSANSR